MDSPLGDFTRPLRAQGQGGVCRTDLQQPEPLAVYPPRAQMASTRATMCAARSCAIPFATASRRRRCWLSSAMTIPRIENLYSMAKYRLAAEWSSACKHEVERLVANCAGRWKPETAGPHRPGIHLHRYRQNTGHRRCPVRRNKQRRLTLFVAIADPTAYIDADSELHRDIAARAHPYIFTATSYHAAGAVVAGYLRPCPRQRSPCPGLQRSLSAIAARSGILSLSRPPCAHRANCRTTGRALPEWPGR